MKDFWVKFSDVSKDLNEAFESVFLKWCFHTCKKHDNNDQTAMKCHILSSWLQGELTMTTGMESLQNAIFLDTVPDSWTKRSYPSMCGLTLWFIDLLARIKELDAWSSDFLLPSTVWLAGFFNPQSFLTAIMQTTARR